MATAALAPGDEGFNEDSRSTHRMVAFSSIGVATAGSLIMLFGARINSEEMTHGFSR